MNTLHIRKQNLAYMLTKCGDAEYCRLFGPSKEEQFIIYKRIPKKHFVLEEVSIIGYANKYI